MAFGQNSTSDSDNGASWGGPIRPFTPKRRGFSVERMKAEERHKAAKLAKRRAHAKDARKARRKNR